MNIKLTRREKILLMLFVLTCIYVAFYKTCYGRMREYLAMKAEAQKKREIFALLQGIYTNQEDISDRIKNSLSKLPTEEKITDFIIELENWAKAENITLYSIKPGEIAETGISKVKSIPVEITLEGQKESLIRFLSRMESFERISQLGRVSLEFSGADELWRSEMTIYLFYCPLLDQDGLQ